MTDVARESINIVPVIWVMVGILFTGLIATALDK